LTDQISGTQLNDSAAKIQCAFSAAQGPLPMTGPTPDCERAGTVRLGPMARGDFALRLLHMIAA
jgi:hypothetical protein